MHGEPTEGKRGSHKNTLEASRNVEGGQVCAHEVGTEVEAFLEAGPTQPASTLHTQGQTRLQCMWARKTQKMKRTFGSHRKVGRGIDLRLMGT